jgi:hypothetical protein
MKKLEELPWYQELIVATEKSTTLLSIKIVLEAKFGTDGLELMRQINEISDFEKLKQIFLCLAKAQTLNEVQQVI